MHKDDLYLRRHIKNIKKEPVMPFKAEFTFESLDELQQFVSSKINTPVPTPAIAPADKKDRTLKSVKGPKPEILPPEPENKIVVPSFIGKKSPEKTTGEKPLTYDYISQATLDAVKAAGRDKVKELLSAFGALKATELSEDQWPDYMKRCGTLIKSAAPKEELEEALA